MSPASILHVVGMRTDGTIGANLALDSLSKARVFASLLRWQNEDWTVNITNDAGDVIDSEVGQSGRFGSTTGHERWN